MSLSMNSKDACRWFVTEKSFPQGQADFETRQLPLIIGASSGSRGLSTPTPISLGFVRDRAVDTKLALGTHGASGWLHATWEVPGGSALGRILWLSCAGYTPVRWFTKIDVNAPNLHARYRWSARVLNWSGRLCGLPLPKTRHIPLSNPFPVARWMGKVIVAGGTPCLHTFPSSAVRLCQVAADNGIDLHGAYFAVVGEPLTAARLARIHSVGANVVPVYDSTEAGRIGYGCCRPSSPDDVHFLNDLLALIQPEGEAQGVFPDHALLVSSLRPTAPFVLLNVSLGDQGIVSPSQCGCPMEELGWVTHIHTIQSQGPCRRSHTVM
jgi:hypothetical protein